jgi:hypothetical protein
MGERYKGTKIMKSFGILALAVAMAVASTPPASAEEVRAEVNFAWLSVGTGTTINEGHTYWVGEFSGTATDIGEPSMFGNSAWKCPAWFDVDFPNNRNTAGGYCIGTLTTGDSLYISWTCEASLEGATGQGPFPFGKDNFCDGKSTVIGGTGALAGVTGDNTFQGQTILFHADGKGSGLSPLQWRLVIPD